MPETNLSIEFIFNFNFINSSHTFYDSAFSASLHCAVGADTCLKVCKQAFLMASELVTTDFHPYIHFIPKNDELATY